jgi:hypothetical protein
VVYTECTSTSAYGPIGGIRAYSLGSNTCNVGEANLLWTNDGTPGLAMNMYRLHGGRLEQIGMSWLKTACCAAASNGCGMSCNGVNGNMLGVGCLDVYSAGWNAIQSNLSPRSGINAYTGTFSPIPGGTFNDLTRRLQVAEADMSSTTYPGALYFIEGQYISTDDAAAGRALNNASYKRVTVGATFALTLQGTMNTNRPAIYAWLDHGLGVNTPDPAVQVSAVDVPGEGRFHLAAKVTNLGGGRYRYDYALHNLNSHRSAASFRVPIPDGGVLTNVYFHDVDYHSGEPYDPANWNATIGNLCVTWNSPQTFAQNANTNALRFGTMYNFSLEVDSPPATGAVRIGLFRPGDPESLTAAAPVPAACALAGDVAPDGQFDSVDLGAFVECLLGGVSSGNCQCADIDQDCVIGDADVNGMVSRLVGP